MRKLTAELVVDFILFLVCAAFLLFCFWVLGA